MKIFNSKKKHTRTLHGNNSLYDYSGTFEREQTVDALLERACMAKDDINAYWRKMRRYYDGEHDIRSSTSLFSQSQELPWVAAQSTDGYIHVETQIESDIPDFEFSPRNSDDSVKAKQRQNIVKYICDQNDMKFMNSRNERRLNILGSAIWKVCWNSGTNNLEGGGVVIDNPSPEFIFTDPSALTVDECEYIGFVYKMHVQKAKRVFENDFKNLGCTIDDFLSHPQKNYSANTLISPDYDDEQDTVTVTEWWFRQPDSSSTYLPYRSEHKDGFSKYCWNSGDIGLCIFINGKEVRYVPKYWANTSCQMYPFVIYNKIPNDCSIWGKSELEQIIPLIDAKDRDLAYAQLNSAFSSNDIILAEENALSDENSFDNSPGAVWKLRPGMMGKIQRLGNISSSQASLQALSARWESMIENTTGNFDVNQGREPTNVTTATGIALLNERAKSRKTLKNIDRNAGFKRLYSLIDYTALEFFDDGMVLQLDSSTKDNIVYKYSEFTKNVGGRTYIPGVDVIIHTGGGIENSKAFTVSALSNLANTSITPQNYKLIKAYVDAIGLPQRSEINAYLDDMFGNSSDNSANTKSIDIIDNIENIVSINKQKR